MALRMAVIAILLCSGGFLAGGCDKSSSTPLPKPEGQADNRPTTQEINAAPRKPLALGAYPLVLKNAPASWELKTTEPSDEALVTLEGVTPAGEAHIVLARQHGITYTLTRIKMLEADARKQMAEKPGVILLAELRQLGDARVFEKRWLRSLPATQATMTMPDGATKSAAVEASRNIEWTIMVFVPTRTEYVCYSLTFIGLSEEQYAVDKDYLDAIMNSLQYDPVNSAL